MKCCRYQRLETYGRLGAAGSFAENVHKPRDGVSGDDMRHCSWTRPLHNEDNSVCAPPSMGPPLS